MVADDCVDHELRRTYREDDDYMGLEKRELIPELPEPAERIRLRELVGVTQLELSKHVGVTRQMIYQYERGLSEPTGSRRAKYAVLLTAWAATEKRAG